MNHFEDDGTRNYLVFWLIYRCFKKISNSKCILVWKLKVLSDENIKPPATSNNSTSPALNYINAKIQVKFDGSCLK